MKTPILLLMFICLAELTFSQGGYRPGYVITNAGDTLAGLVDYREGIKVYRSCDFKSSESQVATTYKPGDIIGYGFKNDKAFQSRTISLKNQSPRVVFLELIVRGIVSLYRFESIYFVEKGKDGLQSLQNESVEAFVDGRRVKRYSNQHIGTMNMLLFDCVEIRERLQDLKLGEKVLTNLIEDYNQCKGEPSVSFKSKKPWTKATVGAIGGISVSKLHFINPVYPHLSGSFAVSKSPMFGISLDVWSPRLSERVAFHSDLLYLASQYYSYTLFENSYSAERNYVTLELQQLKIPIGLSYVIRRADFTPYFKIGVSGTIHLRSDPEWIQEMESNKTVDTYRFEALPSWKNQLGVWAGCGLLKTINDKLNATVELRYERTRSFFDGEFYLPTSLQSKIENVQILIGIRTK